MVDLPKVLFEDQHEWLDNDILYNFVLNSFEDVLQKYFEDILDQNWVQVTVRKIIGVLEPEAYPSEPEVITYSTKKQLQSKFGYNFS